MITKRKYVEQFHRVIRWYSRIFRIPRNRGRIGRPATAEDEFLDDLYAFFINCYHFKDWIEKDTSIAISRSDVDRFISKNPHLKLCADLCNSSKHLRLASTGWSGQTPKVRETVIVARPATDKIYQSTPSIEASVVDCVIDTLDGPVEAFNLATNCLLAWEQFLLSHFEIRIKRMVEGFDEQVIPGKVFRIDGEFTLPPFSGSNLDFRHRDDELGRIIWVANQQHSWLIILRLKFTYPSQIRTDLSHILSLHLENDRMIWLIVAMDEVPAAFVKQAREANCLFSTLEDLEALERLLVK